MRESPGDLEAERLLDVVRRGWNGEVERLAYLPLGFGAHHWTADVGGEPVFFVASGGFGTTRDHCIRCSSQPRSVLINA